MKKSAFLLVTSDSPSCHLAIIALTLLEALHRELHTRHPSARRDLILPAGPSPSSPLGLQGPVLPHAQQQGLALLPPSSFVDLGIGSEQDYGWYSEAFAYIPASGFLIFFCTAFFL